MHSNGLTFFPRVIVYSFWVCVWWNRLRTVIQKPPHFRFSSLPLFPALKGNKAVVWSLDLFTVFLACLLFYWLCFGVSASPHQYWQKKKKETMNTTFLASGPSYREKQIPLKNVGVLLGAFWLTRDSSSVLRSKLDISWQNADRERPLLLFALAFYSF